MADAKSELYELARINAKPQKNSGRGSHAKGDGVLGPFCVDVKESKTSFTLSRNVWAKISGDAHTSGMLSPALKVVLGDGEQPKIRMMIIDEAMFLEMYEAWSIYQKALNENAELMKRLADGD